MTPKRPFGVTLFLWMVLSLSAWGAVRLLATLRWWGVLYEFGARLGPPYLSIAGAGWIFVGGVLLWSLGSGRAWARWAIPISVGVWLVEYWIERLLFQASRANLPFALTASALILIVTLTITFHRSTKDFFTRSEEHEQPDEGTLSA